MLWDDPQHKCCGVNLKINVVHTIRAHDSWIFRRLIKTQEFMNYKKKGPIERAALLEEPLYKGYRLMPPTPAKANATFKG